MARSNTTFGQGNKAAEKWTKETVYEKLSAMWEALTTDDDGERPKNPVRANDIKLLGEICLMFGIGKQRWSEWEKKFKKYAPVSELMANIKYILECRMIYSGSQMDQFVLKNHYDFKDKTETGVTDKLGNDVKPPASPIMFISADKLTDAQLEKYMTADAGSNNQDT